MLHAVRGFFRFAHIDGLIAADPAVYARLPKIHADETRTQALDRLELIRFLQIAQTLTVHHGALAYLLGISGLRASEAAARIEDYAAGAPRAAPGRQGQQARHHAPDRAGAPDRFAEEGASLFVDLCRSRVNRRLPQVRCRRVTPSPWKTR